MRLFYGRRDGRSVFADGFGGEADAEFLEDLAVDFAGHDGGVHLAAVERTPRWQQTVSGMMCRVWPYHDMT